MSTENGSGVGGPPLAALEAELAAMRSQVTLLRSENAPLRRLLELTPLQGRRAGADGDLRRWPGSVHSGSPPAVKVAFFAALFGARSDVYAVRWENSRFGQVRVEASRERRLAPRRAC